VDSNRLEPVANAVTASFRALSEQERQGLRPLRVRVVTVQAGDNVATLAARMSGVEQPQQLFRIINGLGPGETPSAGTRVKIVTDR
jgi:predicted Zn-dependent protease